MLENLNLAGQDFPKDPKKVSARKSRDLDMFPGAGCVCPSSRAPLHKKQLNLMRPWRKNDRPYFNHLT